MNALQRHYASAFAVFTLLFLPLLYCRSEGARGFNPRQPFIDPEAVTVAREAGTVAPRTATTDQAPAVADPRSWQAVPLAGRLVGLVPQDFDRWQWAADNSLTLIVHSTAGRLDGVIYLETIAGGPWASLELDGFHRTVAPQLASKVLPWFATQPPGLVEALQKELKLSKGAAVENLAKLRSRTLGLGLGFRSSRTAFTGWRWVGANPQGVRLRLGRLEGIWGQQPVLDQAMEQLLEVLADGSPKFAVPGTAEVSLAENVVPSRAAALVLGSALLRRDLGIHLAVLFEQGSSGAVVDELAAFIGSIRPPESGEMRGLFGARGPGDLERLVDRLGWTLQLDAQRVTEEDLQLLGKQLGGPPEGEEGGEG